MGPETSPRKRQVKVACAAVLLTSATFISSTAQSAPLPKCSALAGQLTTNRQISAVTSAVQPSAGAHLPYCLVNITVSAVSGPRDGYLPGQSQQVKVGIGLPLSIADSGSGGVQGNWNGRIEDLGGGGYAGSVGSVTGATDAGYAGSSTDTGHSASLQGTFDLNPDGSLNEGLIDDFAFNGIHEQAIWTKNLVELYYGKGPKYTYWNGCSTGGRQGHEQAQMYPTDFDGILAGAPAFNWDRFIPAEQWGQIVMNQEVGSPISPAKLTAVTNAAIAACDALDGITDGIIQDPRACHYRAESFVCTASPSDNPNCLTPAEASAVDKIWQGPTKNGEQLWFGLEPGTSLAFLDGASPFSISTQWLQYWVQQDPSFDWHIIREATFPNYFTQSELKFHDVLGTDNPDLRAFRDNGGKMILYHGLADFLIFPRGSYNYYNRVEDVMGGLKQTLAFYRFFPYPGNGHCGSNPTQPNAPLINSTDLFNALVNWVEDDVAPDSIIAYNNVNEAMATVSRPICKYPDKLVYKGTGSTNEAANFTCVQQNNDPLHASEHVIPDPGARGEGRP